MQRLFALLLIVPLASCGGVGGSGSGGNAPPPVFDVSGSVASGITGAPIAGVTITLSGDATASTTTDGTGSFRFTGLEDGTYALEANQVDAAFSPAVLPLTVSGANVAKQDFVGFRGSVVGSGIEFLPQSFLSSNQLRVSLKLADGDVVYTDSSDAPLKKQPLDGSPATILAGRFTGADNVVLHGGDLYWIAGGDLYRMAPGGQATLLADGLRDSAADITNDIVVDDTHAYWVDEAPTQPCSPACNWIIKKVPLDGGAAVDLASADRRIDSLKGDALSIYWEEGSLEPWEAGCDCGSKIKMIGKAGGAETLLVDGSLNGGLPAVPPGHTPASWMPTGGIAVAGNDIIFAVTGNLVYDLKSIPIAGGPVSDLASVATNTSFARNATLNLSVRGDTVYWLDNGNANVSSMSAAGGAVTVLASGLAAPGALAVGDTDAYWTELGDFVGCCLAVGGGRLNRVPLAGGPVSAVADNLDAPGAVTTDAAGVAWTEAWRIGRLDFGGGSPVTLQSGIASDLAQIAVSNGTVYILDSDFIKVVPLAGGTVEKLASARLGKLDDLAFADADIAADDQNVYWSLHPTQGTVVVQQVPLGGGTPVTISTPGGVPNPQDCVWRLAVVNAAVYWSDGTTSHPVGCAIKKVAAGGGAVTTLVDEAYVADFTVDGTDVWYSQFLGSTPSIRKLPADGGSSTLVAENVAGGVMANDNERIYWLDLQFDSLGYISKAPGTGTGDWVLVPVDVVVNPFLVFDDLVIDADGLIFSEALTEGIYRIY